MTAPNLYLTLEDLGPGLDFELKLVNKVHTNNQMRFFSPKEFWKSTRRSLSEFPPKTQIDNKVDGGIEDEREVI